MNPFDFVTSINSSKKNLMKGTENDQLAEKTYNAFLTNKSLSYFADTIQLANMMNCNHGLDNKLQYLFLINIVRPSKRFSKWVKKDKDSDLELVMSYYGYNRQKAKAAIKLLSPDQMKTIRNKLDKGGIRNERSR
jgi:hypothetical protein